LNAERAVNIDRGWNVEVESAVQQVPKHIDFDHMHVTCTRETHISEAYVDLDIGFGYPARQRHVIPERNQQSVSACAYGRSHRQALQQERTRIRPDQTRRARRQQTHADTHVWEMGQGGSRMEVTHRVPPNGPTTRVTGADGRGE